MWDREMRERVCVWDRETNRERGCVWERDTEREGVSVERYCVCVG